MFRRLLWAGLFCPVAAIMAQSTIREAVDSALARYPAIRIPVEQKAAAEAGITLARTAYLPRVDFHTQLNRATRNNIYGMIFPQTVIPPISGPPNPENSMTNVWGSAVGILVSWEPFDFGFRQARVGEAEAGRRRAESALERTRLEVATRTADSFLTILAAQQTVKAAAAGVERARVFSNVVEALVKADLRPGAELSRARAEAAMALAAQIQAEQAVAVAKADLIQFTGADPASVSVAAGPLLGETTGLETMSAIADAHPVLREQDSVIGESQARQKTLDRSFFPKFQIQGAQYARGTGARPDFTTGGAASGLGPNIYNWGVAVGMTMPLMDFASIRAKKQIESAGERTERARYDQLRADLTARLERARAMLDGARRVAQVVPVQLEAARAAETQASARYKAGLGTLVEVAEAQRLLTQTEIDYSLARLAIWRGLLAVAAAQGDLEPFLKQAGN
ncbi:MAG: TolC family protein [Bryobacteraceae bacterium]